MDVGRKENLIDGENVKKSSSDEELIGGASVPGE